MKAELVLYMNPMASLRVILQCHQVASVNVLETQLISKMCAFALVGLLYQRLPVVAVSSPDSSINKTFCKTTGVKTGKELTQAVTK